jgi:hypothetical protein
VRERGGAVACRSIDPTTAAAGARMRSPGLYCARARACGATHGSSRKFNRIARDRVVANQIIGPRARARTFFIFIFMAEYFI